eukprot:9879645-Alexandrium_andersonii.AAC.1
MKSDLDAMMSHVRCAPNRVASDTNEPLYRGGCSIFAVRHTLQYGFFGKWHSMWCVLRASM